MTTAIVTLSSEGQVLFPQAIRDESFTAKRAFISAQEAQGRQAGIRRVG
jgi:hypothetical protein